MTRKVEATYDGETVHPDEPLQLAPNSRFVMTYEPIEETGAPAPVSFIDVALANPVHGPADWSERVDHYLYGGVIDEED
ncbi:hypothetical protein [Longimicrobium sp.]|uniref:hypothetical protein n=1 Tax=Longimicrobium sp. TaxID=2029185 RepID=UPI002CE62D01|nr:hypothetical protein [Longimicrobium sp.]HSU17233.1 hypothetical protein [Longimicrobium sp.]